MYSAQYNGKLSRLSVVLLALPYIQTLMGWDGVTASSRHLYVHMCWRYVLKGECSQSVTTQG